MSPEQLEALIWFVNRAVDKAVQEARDEYSGAAWSAEQQLRRAERELREAFKEQQP